MPSAGWPDHPRDDNEGPDEIRCECGCGELVPDDAPDVEGLLFVSVKHYQAWMAYHDAQDRARMAGLLDEQARVVAVEDSGLHGNGAGQERGSPVSTHAQVLTSQNAMPGKGENPGVFHIDDEQTEPIAVSCPDCHERFESLREAQGRRCERAAS